MLVWTRSIFLFKTECVRVKRSLFAEFEATKRKWSTFSAPRYLRDAEQISRGKKIRQGGEYKAATHRPRTLQRTRSYNYITLRGATAAKHAASPRWAGNYKQSYNSQGTNSL